VLSRAIVFGKHGEPRPTDLVYALRARTCEMVEAKSSEQFMELADRYLPDCLIVMHAAEVDSEVLRLIAMTRQIDHRCPIIVFAGRISTTTALQAMRAGASDLLDSGSSQDEIQRALHSADPRCSEDPKKLSPVLAGCVSRMVGCGPAMTTVKEQILRAAASNANVLITGESGTGKEVAAELIHQNSSRSKQKFVALNCAAIPDSLFESELFGHERGAFTGASAAREGKLQHAAGGTLFLDEVGDMPLSAQAKILRAIESRVVHRLGSNTETRIQARLIAATNQGLEVLAREKKFRQDLYFRLNVVRITIPPLRERLEDIPQLVEHLLCDMAKNQGQQIRHMESDIIRRFQQHDWPGNVRELRNVIESILVFSSSRRLGLADVPQHIRQCLNSNHPRFADERSKILVALGSSQWNRKQAAEALNCSRMTLYRKMVKYSIPAFGE
jgi:DNA-binding NtrC family response regulator